MRRQSEGHSESHVDSSSAPFAGGLTEVSHLVIENEKLRRKLKKVQQRRDHYARLYYRILADFDETKWELTVARNKIREMKSQAVQDQKPPPPPPPLHPHLLLRSSSGPHPQQTHVSGSTTTSPDSGTSMSPKIQQVAQNPFLHQQQQQQQYRSSARSARSKSLPRNLSNKISDAPPPPPAPSLINYKNGMVMKYGHEVPVPTTTRNETDSDSHSHTSRNARQLPKPPREAFIQGPNSYHHHHNPLFPQKRPLDRCVSLSQGDSSSVSYSGPLVSFQKIPPHQKQAFALSQESYVPSPPIFRKTTFERTMSQPQAGSRKSHSMRSALKRPAFERTSLSQDDTISECDHISAFRKPITRKMSQPLTAAEGYHHHHHNPPSTASQHHSSPPIHPPSHHHHHPHTLTGLQQLPLPHPTLSQTTSSPQQFDGYSVSSFERSGAPSPSTISRVSVTSTTTCTSVGTPACCNYTSRPPPSQEHSYEGLTGVQLLDLMARISDPACTLTKLEVSNSQLGNAEAMGVFCEDLLRNKSVIELSLPNNGINCESLKILLDCIEHCDNIKELMLRNNQIGQDCAEVIKQFLTKTNLDSLVLTGNEIEQYGHLLNGGLPSDFTMEYDTTDGSEDSGLAVGESENAFSSSRPSDHSLAMHFKYLHI